MTTSQVGLRPRSISELLDAGISLYRGNFLHFLAIAAVSQLPVGLITAGFGAVFYSGQIPSVEQALTGAGSPDAFQPALIGGVVLGALILALLGFVATSFSRAAMIYSIEQRIHGHRPGVGTVFSHSVPRVPVLLAAGILYFLATSLVFLPGVAAFGAGIAISLGEISGGTGTGVLLIVLGLILLLAGFILSVMLRIRWQLHAQAVIVEQRGSVDSLRRSSYLVRDRWWFTLGFVIVLSIFISILSAIPGLLVQVPTMFFVSASGEPGFMLQLLNNAVSAITQIFMFPVQVILMTLLYFDYRVRKEALDLEEAVSGLTQENT